LKFDIRRCGNARATYFECHAKRPLKPYWGRRARLSDCHVGIGRRSRNIRAANRPAVNAVNIERYLAIALMTSAGTVVTLSRSISVLEHSMLVSSFEAIAVQPLAELSAIDGVDTVVAEVVVLLLLEEL